jgi:hypothetical protein
VRAALGIENLSQLPWPDLAHERFAATGLQKITREELLAIRRDMDAVAATCAFPATSLRARQEFDRRIAIMLSNLKFPIGEMVRPDVWTWIAVNLVPHLVTWRFGTDDGRVSEDRFLGILQRNAFGRLWLRGRVFDRGPDSDDRWGLVNAISEDASVAILERTSIAGDWVLARIIGEEWLAERKAGKNADRLLRDAAVRIRMNSAILETGIFSVSELADSVRSRFVDDSAGEKIASGDGLSSEQGKD